MSSSPPSITRVSYLGRALSIALDSALIVAAIEVVGLLVRIPGTRTPSSILLLGLGAVGAAALVTLPVAALAALPFPDRRPVRYLGASWWALSAVAVAVVASAQRVLLRNLVTDYGWLRVLGLLGLGFVVCGLPAAFLLRRELHRRRVRRYGIAALLVALIAGGLALGSEVFIRMQPQIHGLLGVAGAACVALLRALLHDGRRPPWLAGAALALGLTLMLPALRANHVVHAHAAHDGLLLADLLHLVHPDTRPMPAVPAAHVSAPAGRPLDARPRLVLLITIDSLRYDITRSLQLPALSALRARSIELTRARSTAGYTIAAMYSLLTGQGPWRIQWQPLRFSGKGRSFTVQVPVADGIPTLAGVLAGHGYQTATCAVMLAQAPGWGLSNGFANIDMTIAEERNLDARGITADRVAGCARQMLAGARGQPLFLWLHYFDPHGPYAVHDGIEVDESDPLDRYRGEVRFVDQHLGAFLTELEQQVSWDEMLVIVTSDHGEEFGDHGGAAHVYNLYDETLRVPLLIAAPGLGVSQVDDPVSLLDIVPTVLALLDVPPPPALDGISLVPALRGERLPQRSLFAETIRLGRAQRAIIDGNYKLVFNARFHTYELYDLARDPGEQWSLADALPEVTARLARQMGVPAPGER
jgi:MFS family permease